MIQAREHLAAAVVVTLAVALVLACVATGLTPSGVASDPNALHSTVSPQKQLASADLVTRRVSEAESLGTSRSTSVGAAHDGSGERIHPRHGSPPTPLRTVTAPLRI